MKMKNLEDLIRRYPALEGNKESIWKAYEILAETYKNDGKVLICGNGGSASDAEHIVGELMKEFHRKRPVPAEFAKNLQELEEDPSDLINGLQGTLMAISLNSQTSIMTAFCNDADPSLVFAQQVLGYGRKGDTLIGLSTSGNSANVLKAARTAKALGMKVVLISGKGGGKIAPLADAAICLPETDTYKIQEYTLPVYHTLCLMLEDTFFSEGESKA